MSPPGGSADLEPRRNSLRLGRLSHHRIHTGQRRAVLQPRGEALDGIGIADGEHFDATVGEIAGVAAQAQRLGLCPGVDAEGDALHAPADEEARGRHRDQPAALPSMTAARSAFVTGPMNSFAILPSGAMM